MDEDNETAPAGRGVRQRRELKGLGVAADRSKPPGPQRGEYVGNTPPRMGNKRAARGTAGHLGNAFFLASRTSQHRDIGKTGGFRLPPFHCITPSQRRFLCAREELKLSSIQ